MGVFKPNNKGNINTPPIPTHLTGASLSTIHYLSSYFESRRLNGKKGHRKDERVRVLLIIEVI